MKSIIAKLNRVSKVYRVGEIEIHALSDIDLEVRQGEFIVMLGPSGSGKTTLLNMIGGLDSPSSGEIEVNGTRLDQSKDRERTMFRKQQIGFVFQFFNLIPTLTAYENVALSVDLSDNRDLTAGQVLGQVGLEQRQDHFPSQLSGGEQQRVAIARALAKDTPVMLCDEPTGELDFETGIKILALLRSINKESDKTFILVTHNSAIGQIADRVIKLRSGRVVEDEFNSNPINPMDLSW